MLNLDSKKTALVLIDLQQGILPYAQAPFSGSEIVERAQGLVKHFHQVNANIFRVRVGWSTDGAEMLKQPVDMVTTTTTPPNNWWHYPETLPLAENEIEITKRQWGAFYGTDLELQLRRRNIDTLVLGGISTNIGVESTARTAWELGFSLIIAADLCSAASIEQHNSSMNWIFPRIARVRNTIEIIQALTD